MKIFIATDHAGIAIKDDVIEMLKKLEYDVVDLGPSSDERVDYADYAHKLCEKVLQEEGSDGVLICGTGIGMSLAANKHKGIRATLCHNGYTAKMAKEHNQANVLCFGQRVVGLGVIEEMLHFWKYTEFAGGRHTQRVGKIES